MSRIDDGYTPGAEMSSRVAEQLKQRREEGTARWRRDPGREASLVLIFVVTLATLVMAASAAKVGSYGRLGRDDEATYWMESAQRFRYVEMVAEGKEIPAIDARMQAPDGYPTRSDTIGQEILYGTLARHRPEDWSVARFTRVLTRVIAASAVIPMVWLAFVATRRRDAALLAGLLYGLALPVAERGNGAVLFREDLAVPVLLMHLAAVGGWARSPHWARALLAGVLLAGSMLLWKVTTFYALMLLVFLATAWWVRGTEPGRVGDAVLMMFGPVAIASVAPWSLKHDQFLTSTPALVAGGLAFAAFLAARVPRLPPLLGSLLVVGVVIWGRLLLPVESAYAHAWETIVAKTTSFDSKPLDPTELSFHARHYWTGNYESPTLRRLVRDWPFLVAVAIPGVFALVAELRRGGAPWPGKLPPPPTGLLEGDGPSEPMSPLLSWFVLWLVAGFLASYLLFVKLTLWAAVALALLGAVGWSYPRRLRKTRRLLAVPFIALVALHGLGVVPGLDAILYRDVARSDADAVSEVVVFPPDGFEELVTWMGENTGEDEAILASFQLSPFLLTYVDRPTVLHCFFEGDLLPRLQEIITARFSDEATLAEAARRYGATWYVHEAQFPLRTDPRMSQRYVAGAMEWPKGSVSVAMSWAPERLEHFDLAWENDWFRVFRVLPEGQRANNRVRSTTRPLWSRPLFTGLFGDPIRGLSAKDAGLGLAPDDLLYSTLKAETWLRYTEANRNPEEPTDRFPEQEYGLHKAVEVAPYHYEAHDSLARLYSAMGRGDRAARSRATADRAAAVLRGTLGTTPEDAPRKVPRIP